MVAAILVLLEASADFVLEREPELAPHEGGLVFVSFWCSFWCLMCSSGVQ